MLWDIIYKSIIMKKVVLSLHTIFFLIIFACSSEPIDEESKTARQYTLTITASEGGRLSPDANGKYNKGATITVTATPEEGYMFDRWVGVSNDYYLSGGCWRLHGICRTSITMNSDRDVQAFFKKIE